MTSWARHGAAAHQDVAEALEEVYAADLEPHLAELAQHFFVAAPRRGWRPRRSTTRAAPEIAL